MVQTDPTTPPIAAAPAEKSGEHAIRVDHSHADEHGDRAALRGVPSLVWRDGQERRLQLLNQYAPLTDAQVLVHGVGVGMYAGQIYRRYGRHVHGFDIEPERVQDAAAQSPYGVVARAEALPYADRHFDVVFSHEVIEHVQDDQRTASEMVRVTRPGGRIVIFCPNRWYPFETHGHYWRGTYHFGNTPLINYLPDGLRDRLAPHVRAYTRRGLLRLFADEPVQLVHHSRVYGGYDNLIARLGQPMRAVRDALYRLEGTVGDTWGLSHLLVLERV